MTYDLLQQLEEKVANAVEVIELLRMQVEDLETENHTLKSEQERWRSDLAGLIKRLGQIDNTPAVPRIRVPAKATMAEAEEEFMTV